MRRFRWLFPGAAAVVATAVLSLFAAGQGTNKNTQDKKNVKPTGTKDTSLPEGFISLFNGKDLEAWRIPKGDNDHWKLTEELIDYDARSAARGEKHLWSRKAYRDFVLLLDWRLKNDPGRLQLVPLLEPDGRPRKDARGRERTIELDDLRAGVLLRGKEKNRVNIGKWPIGSGQIGSARPDPSLSPTVRAACTPKEKADNTLGEWNTFEITVKGDRVAVKLNGKEIIADAPLPEWHKEGPIGLEHCGSLDPRGRWKDPPSLVQFRNIAIKELK
jgi:hypothetical protein